MPSIPNNYAELVRAKRLARGWTQAELAELLGLTNVTISRWEQGRVEPSSAFWEKFLEATGGHTKPSSGTRKAGVSKVVDFMGNGLAVRALVEGGRRPRGALRSEEHTSELQSHSFFS